MRGDQAAIDHDNLVKEDGKIWLAWILAVNQQWYLCSMCKFCQALIEYPSAPHKCPQTGTDNEIVEKLKVEGSVETSLEEELEKLRCDENFLASES